MIGNSISVRKASVQLRSGLLLLLLVGSSALFGQSPDYLSRLDTQADFDLLKGKPLNAKYGQVESIKLVLDLRTDSLYFISSDKFEWHYDFCHQRLGFWQSNYLYNQANYSDSPNRRYALANINYLPALYAWTLEFSSADQIPVDQVERLYRRVTGASFIGDQLAIFVNTDRLATAFPAVAHGGIPIVTPDEVYQGLEYQALNCKVGFGYLRRIHVDSLEMAPPGPTDIVVLEGTALDIPAVAGLMSPEFQTPLSHLNILCKNRGTPFLAQKGIWDDPRTLDLENQLVRFEVFQDSFSLRPCKLADAEQFWMAQRPKKVQRLKMNVKQSRLQEMRDLGLSSVSLVGGKASNFAELSRLAAESDGKFKVPEGAFAIPFYWYWQHFQASGAQALVDSLLADREAMADSRLLNRRLHWIQATMQRWPLNPQLIKLVEDKVHSESPTMRVRFRSSTNAEDIPGFNGAGLYDSKTGIVGDPVRTVEKAIKEVWASLWNYRAFQEREFYRIDHRNCAMGLLVHRSFPDEYANGVAITKNLYRPDYYGFVINVQRGEASVVSPPLGVTCEQLICYSDSDLDFYNKKRIVEYIARSSITDGAPVLSQDQVVLLTEQLAMIKKHYFARSNLQYVEDADANTRYNRYALDVEFKFDGPDNSLYIKQVRPYQD